MPYKYQLHAGSILEGARERVNDLFKSFKASLDGLYRSLSTFDLDSSFELQKTGSNGDPLFFVLSNMLSRGLPTRLSFDCECELAGICEDHQEWNDPTGSIGIRYHFSEEVAVQYVRALHIIDPRLSASGLLQDYRNSWEELGSVYEEDFYYRQLPSVLGTDAICQLLETQREFKTIVESNKGFVEQRVDFSFEFPYEINFKKGVILEVDGSQHKEKPQKTLDDERDRTAEESGWMKTIRIRTDQWNAMHDALRLLLRLSEEKAFKRYRQNYEQPIYQTETGLNALQLALSPFGIARIQKVIAEAILAGILDLGAEQWTIVVAERDVPCAGLAICDFERIARHLFALEGSGRTLPRIDFHILVTEEFVYAKLNEPFKEHIRKMEDDHSNLECDLLIDISMLQRGGFSRRNPRIQYRHWAVIRSTHSSQTPRRFNTAGLIKYPPLADKVKEEWIIREGPREHMDFFLQMIFRKKEFRPGQLEILNRALQGETVIGLLPTGAGKSLTYQLATLLQPGVVLVVDPIKSLMKDQYDGLRKQFIDTCDFINSSRPGVEKRRAMHEFEDGRYLFLFVSPERFQMEEFRSMLARMFEWQVYFSYCVIDEVHCVSEWGHDFRTSYLRLGENTITHCRTANLDSVPLFGLTATASFDVLSDVQRELSGRKANARIPEDAIIRAETVNRPELIYHVVKVQPENMQSTNNSWIIKKAVGLAKQKHLKSLLENMPKVLSNKSSGKEEYFTGYDPKSVWGFFDENNINAGLVLCPHRTGDLGVTNKYDSNKKPGIAEILQAPYLRIGTFIGSSSDNNKLAAQISQDSLKNQDRFINNEINLMVATNAFGMGIDKPNIRFTVHMNYPQSLESFVQEAGRAGRDRQPAVCSILYCDPKYHVDEKILFFFTITLSKELRRKSTFFSNYSSVSIFRPHDLWV